MAEAKRGTDPKGDRSVRREAGIKKVCVEAEAVEREKPSIQLFKPVICDEAIQAVVDVLKSGWIGLGPKTREFELAFSQYVGVPYSVATSSATAALHMALNVIGVGPGDEVITTPITFVSTNHAILYTGAIPVFVDVNETDLNIDVNQIEQAINDKTKAIMVVHYGGKPCDMNAIEEIAAKRGIWIIQDAAHACGATYRGCKIGNSSYPKTLVCFSFHAVKNLPCGDGGMITTNDEHISSLLRKDRWLGIDKDTISRTDFGEGVSGQQLAYLWRYTVERVGFKAHMNDIAAAIGLAQLKRLNKDNRHRFGLVREYLIGIHERGIPVVPLSSDDDRSSSNHLFVIKAKNRDKLIVHLKANNIHPGVHYFPNHLYPAFKGAKTFGSLPVASKVWEEILSLPLHLHLHLSDVHRIIDVMAEGW